jgi:hypothetical protein
MQAVHPKTGKPIKIMRTETNLTKTNRTLLWHAPTLQPSPRWHRWSILVTDPQSLKTQPKPEIVFIYEIKSDEDKQTWYNWVKTATNETLIIASKEALEALRLNVTENESMLATSELAYRYPFLPALKDSDPLEQWVAVIATLMRFHRLVGTYPMINTTFQGIIKTIGPSSNADDVVPPIYLIQQYFEPKNAPSRVREIKQVLEKNIACDYIDKIILLNEVHFKSISASPKVEQVVIGKRLRYYDVLKYVKEKLTQEVYVVFANSDIYLDNTICALYSIDMTKKFLALLRYEDDGSAKEPKLFGPRPDSQDTWILNSTSLDFEPTESDFGFPFGISGCDNAISLEMFKKRFVVANPCLTIKTYHVHNSNIRTYNKIDVIDKPFFLYLDPTAIQEYALVNDISKHRVSDWSQPKRRPFARPIKYVDQNTAATICNMMSRESNYDFGVDSANTYNAGLHDEDARLYKFEGDVFTMPSGVVCTRKELYVGTHPTWKDEWMKANLTVLTNTVHVPELCAVYFPPPLTNSAAKWVLHYLPYVLQVRKHLPQESKPEFIFPNHPDTQRFLQCIKWPEKGEVKMVPYMDDSQLFSQTVYSLTPTANQDVTAENVEILRSLIPPQAQEPNETPVVVIAVDRKDDSIFTRPWAAEVVSNLFSRGSWTTHIVDADMKTEQRMNLLMRADILIAASTCEWEALDWSWLLQKGKTVMELMQDTKPRGDHIHLAGAANLNYILLGVKREPVPYQRQHALEDINKALKAHVFTESLKAEVPKDKLPTIVLPIDPTHAGDTFREMVTIWESRNYVKVERRKDTPFVWWGPIGDTLLYDRPTMKWLQESQPSYKLALYGNSFPENPKAVDCLWSFWPRSPKALEKASLEQAKSYNDRTTKSIFLGRIENGVQRERRTAQDWSNSVSLFHMPIDSSGGPYKYTQEEYLKEISNARFGLCLPGFGPKCNREIEYFALGTVLIVTPGVDITRYAVPPTKGTHYFFAETPEQVQKIVNDTSPERWMEMSIACRSWWRRNASAEGMFRLTWGLINSAKTQLNL